MVAGEKARPALAAATVAATATEKAVVQGLEMEGLWAEEMAGVAACRAAEACCTHEPEVFVTWFAAPADTQ